MIRIPALVLGLTVLASPLMADIIVLKDTNILEVKFVEKKMKDKKVVVVFTDEKGDKREFLEKDIKQWVQKKPSWEKRKEELAWYEKEKAKPRATWDAEARLAKECKKRDLDEQSEAHFQAAYELRKPTIKDEEAEHEKVATWLENDCGLFDEATDEMRQVLDYKRKKLKENTAGARVGLAQWCEKEGLLPEAEKEYQTALEIDAKSSSAKKGLEKVRRAAEFPFDPGLYRSVRGPVRIAANALRRMQNEDGSFGGDAAYYNVHGHRAMTCLSIIALMCQWEFEMLEKGDDAREVPKEIAKAVELLLSGNHPGRTDLQGPDIWGAQFEIDLWARVIRKRAMERYHARVRERLPVPVKEIEKMRKRDGGWMYYDFDPTSAAHPTASAILCLLNARNSGFEMPDGLIEGAVDAIAKSKFGEGTYMYSNDAGLKKQMHPSSSPVGASARSPLCDGALTAAGKGSEESLRYSIFYFFRWRPALFAIKGQGGTHIGKGMVAPYYFLFGHYWMSRVLKLLEGKARHQRLLELRYWMTTYQEPDGTFYDWKGEEVQYKVYGTALAIMTFYHIASTERDPAFFGPLPGTQPQLKPEEKKKEDGTPTEPAGPGKK